jgi:hypothetical protein
MNIVAVLTAECGFLVLETESACALQIGHLTWQVGPTLPAAATSMDTRPLYKRLGCVVRPQVPFSVFTKRRLEGRGGGGDRQTCIIRHEDQEAGATALKHVKDVSSQLSAPAASSPKKQPPIPHCMVGSVAVETK